MFVQEVRVLYITNSQGVKRSQRHIFRRGRELKKTNKHWVRDKVGDRLHHRELQNKGRQSPGWKIRWLSHQTAGRGKPPFALTALANPARSLFWTLKIRPNDPAWPQCWKGNLPSHRCCHTQQMAKDRFYLTSGHHIIPQSCELGFPEVFPLICLLPEMHVLLDWKSDFNFKPVPCLVVPGQLLGQGTKACGWTHPGRGLGIP